MDQKNLMKEVAQNISRFAEKDAKDIMTHRRNIVAVDGEKTLEEAADFMMENVYSRVPVYEEDIDNLIGILHIRDLMKCYMEEKNRGKKLVSLKEYIHEAAYVPETKSIESLFWEMQSSKTHMTVILDEYAMTSGIVTMEDILEELVGDIFDEYDTVSQKILKNADGTYLVSGLVALEDLEEVLEISFESDEAFDFDTLNGFLVDQLEHIPSEDEYSVIDYKGYRFSVQKVEDNIIRTVKIEKQKKEC